HHAESAHVVAPAPDGYEGRDAVRVVAHRCDVGVGLFLRKLYVDSRLAALIGLVEEAWQIAVGVRPHDEVDELLLLEELFAEALGHAAEDAQLQAPAALRLPGAQVIETVAHLLLRILADGARVE